MHHYVIEETFTWHRKDGLAFTDVSYFQSSNSRVLRFVTMVGQLDKAKKYDCRTEAERDRKKYFAKTARTQVIRVEDPEPVNG